MSSVTFHLLKVFNFAAMTTRQPSPSFAQPLLSRAHPGPARKRAPRARLPPGRRSLLAARGRPQSPGQGRGYRGLGRLSPGAGSAFSLPLPPRSPPLLHSEGSEGRKGGRDSFNSLRSRKARAVGVPKADPDRTPAYFTSGSRALPLRAPQARKVLREGAPGPAASPLSGAAHLLAPAYPKFMA